MLHYNSYVNSPLAYWHYDALYSIRHWNVTIIVISILRMLVNCILIKDY